MAKPVTGGDRVEELDKESGGHQGSARPAFRTVKQVRRPSETITGIDCGCSILAFSLAAVSRFEPWSSFYFGQQRQSVYLTTSRPFGQAVDDQRFQALAARIRGMNREAFLGAFINGLSMDLQDDDRIMRPQNVFEALILDMNIERNNVVLLDEIWEYYT